MAFIVIPLVILGIILFLIYAVYRATRKWGVCFLWFLGAGISFLGAAGVLAEYLWGPQWSWNFAGPAGHGRGYAARALVQGIWSLALGVYFKASRRRTVS
jgi:hypothetical protein